MHFVLTSTHVNESDMHWLGCSTLEVLVLQVELALETFTFLWCLVVNEKIMNETTGKESHPVKRNHDQTFRLQTLHVSIDT